MSPECSAQEITHSDVCWLDYVDQTFPLQYRTSDGRTLVLLSDKNERLHGEYSTLNISECPNNVRESFLSQVLEKNLIPQKYFFEYTGMCRDFGKSAQEEESITSFIEGSFGGYSQSESAGTLRASGGTNGGGSETLIIDTSHANEVIRETKNIVPTLKARMGTGGNNVPMLIDNKRLRKLTPLECERLQGFSDNWTQIAYRGKAAADCPDSPRYKAIGNSWAVPVARWIGERIQHALRSRNENHGQ